MDNYFAHRWPGQPTEIQPAEKPGKPGKKTGKRRVWRDVLIILLAVVVLCALIAGCFFGVRYMADKMAQQGGDIGGDDFGVNPPSNSEEEEYEDWDPSMLPQADCDPSVQVNPLSNGEAQAMDPTVIYQKLLPSVVAVSVDKGGKYSSGSGFIISSSGYIITNYHVIEGGLDLTIMRLSDRQTFPAALVGYDKELDLAVLKVEGSHFIPVEIGDSDELVVGQPVYAIGNPMGYLYGTMTDGIVSSIISDRFVELDYPGRLIQTSAALNSGNSGGPLVDAYGRVVGITSAKVTGLVNGSTVVEGLGLAIPISDARPYLNCILRTGVSSRPSIGISCYNGTLDGVSGILVAEVVEGTPAAKVMMVNDFIIAGNGVTVSGVDDLTRIFAELDPGDVVSLTVIRGDKTITVEVELYERLPETEAE